MRSLLLAAAALASGCFNPSFKEDIGCGPGGECPSGTSCGADNICHAGPGPGEPDARGADARELPDAQPDAMTVSCTDNTQCQNPPNPCLLPGTCNADNECDFGAVDCSSMTDECNDGVCNTDDGQCVQVPAREGNDCNGGTVCGAFEPCGNFADSCDSMGTQSRDCTDNTCQLGACVPEEYQDTADCTRVTEGNTCSASTVTGCPASCGNFTGGTCDETGSYTCTCNTFTCQSDVCTMSSASCSQPCTRDQDGVTCSPPTETNCNACSYTGGPCDETGSRTCTCNTFTCSNTVCTQSSVSCTDPCTRVTDGDGCGVQSCGGGNIRDLCCTPSGACTDICSTCYCATC
jgi:hypothetical protein